MPSWLLPKDALEYKLSLLYYIFFISVERERAGSIDSIMSSASLSLSDQVIKSMYSIVIYS